MRMVIDINVLSTVFNQSDRKHEEFKPVLRCIKNRRGKVVYGGKKYMEELSKASKYLKIMRLLGEVIDDEKSVDDKEEEIKILVGDNSFNDSHIIAIVIVGKCSIICSKDKRAHGFFRARGLYPRSFKRPKIYRGLGAFSVLN